MISLIRFLFCPPAHVELKPLSYPVTRCIISDDWMISQKFDKDGKEITVVGFGRTWQDAKDNLQFEIEQEKMYK